MRRQKTHNHREPREVEDALDRELEQTFPGSDPLKITRSAPETQITPKTDVSTKPLMGPCSPVRPAAGTECE